MLRFVQHQKAEIAVLEFVGAEPCRSIGEDHQIILVDLLEHIGAVVSGRSRHPEAGHEFMRLALPVRNQRRRTDDQGGR